MAKKSKSKTTTATIPRLNAEANRTRRIKTEVNRMTRKMEKLLKRKKDNKKGGIEKDGKRHKALLKHIADLQEKV